MPIIPDSLPESLTLREPASGFDPGGVAAALDQAAALWAAQAQAAGTLAAPPDPAGFPDPRAFADALENWRDTVAAAAENALESRPQALEAWRAWFAEEQERLAPHLEQQALAAAVQRAGEALRAELDAAAGRAQDPARPGDAGAASRDAMDALEHAMALGVLDQAEAERAARGLAARVQAALAARAADQDPAGFLKALQAGDFPALDRAGRQRLASRAGLRLALAAAAQAGEQARAGQDAARVPAERGRLLQRRAGAGLRAALAGEPDPAALADAALELAALPGRAAEARELGQALAALPAARALVEQTAWAPPAARFAALDAALEAAGQKKAGAWPASLAAACRQVLEEQAEALAADPAGYVRPEAERRLRAAGLDPAAERESLLLAVLDLQAQAGVRRPCVLSLAENAALRQEWRARDAAGRVEFLASLAGFAGFRRRVAAEVLGVRGPALQLAAESPALCPSEKAAALAAAYAPAGDGAAPRDAASGPAAAGPDAGPGQDGRAAFGHPALTALARSEPQAAQALADLAGRLAAASGDPEDAARLLAALAPEALRLWGQAPTLTAPGEHESKYRQNEVGSLDQIGDENTAPAKPKEEGDGEDTLKGGVGDDASEGAEDKTSTDVQEGKEPTIGETGKTLLINPTGGVIRQDTKGSGFFGAPRQKTNNGKAIHY